MCQADSDIRYQINDGIRRDSVAEWLGKNAYQCTCLCACARVLVCPCACAPVHVSVSGAENEVPWPGKLNMESCEIL